MQLGRIDLPGVSTLVEGLLIGVGVGLILALADFIKLLISRRRQITFLRHRLVDVFNRISDVPDPLPDYGPSTAEHRLGILDWSLKEFVLVVQHRTNALTGSQLADLHEAMNFVTNLTAQMRQAEIRPGISLHQGAYREFTKCKWLGLPQEHRILQQHNEVRGGAVD